MTKLEFSIFCGLIETMVSNNNSRWTDDEDRCTYHLTYDIDDNGRIKIYPTFNKCAHTFEEYMQVAHGCGYSWYLTIQSNISHVPTPCLVLF